MNTRLLSLALVSAVLATACATQPSSGYGRTAVSGSTTSTVHCYDCGTVQKVETVYGARENTRTGAVLGGIVGGVLGNQIGEGDGKTAATVAGAVGGAIAGNAIENKRNEQTFDITVRMDDGRLLVVNQNTVPTDIRVGSVVRVTNGHVVLLK